MNPFLPIILALSTTILPSAGTVLLSDDFSDGNRTAPAWYYAQGQAGSTLTTNGTRQNLLLDAASRNNAQVWTTFAGTTLNIGHTLSVSFNFDATGGIASADDGPFRIGFFNVGSPVNADINNGIGNPSWNGATGYGAFADIHADAAVDTSPESTLRQRTGASDTLWAGAASPVSFTTTLTPSDSSHSVGSTANLAADDLRYLVTFSLTRTGSDTMDLFYQMRDTSNNIISTMNATDGSGIVSSFNTFSVFTGTSVGQDFAIDNVVISVVPEPSSILVFALAPFLTAYRRRR
ncbi:hypothetical protein OVA24_12380 [Luteolibacter sp. SL250]|uniref:hypothetical protein n=1 Tax=Luteolibacter sp. SL250 TaxID=2995170 RepID=UPI0022702D6C|nr:hypothetical protein [Luteolibacter sp. SL250]WAC18036.1 hypothetical protein OVA24_12380 [Luteolibacter sp. SL250]